MKKIFILLITLFSLFTLSSCKNSYSAKFLMKSELNNECKVRFYSLKGRLVLNTSVNLENTSGVIFYNAKLGEGEINVYYEIGDKKALIFSIKGNEEKSDYIPLSTYGKHISVVIETNGKAKSGEIEIKFE